MARWPTLDSGGACDYRASFVARFRPMTGVYLRCLFRNLGSISTFVYLAWPLLICGCATARAYATHVVNASFHRLHDHVARNCASDGCGASPDLYALLDALSHLLQWTRSRLPVSSSPTCTPFVGRLVHAILFKYCHPGGKLVIDIDTERNEEQSRDDFVYHLCRESSA